MFSIFQFQFLSIITLYAGFQKSVIAAKTEPPAFPDEKQIAAFAEMTEKSCAL
jgi:hypothetical protein